MDQAKLESLNQGQLNAANGFLESLFDETKKELIISGAGGTGKTHTMGIMIDEVMPEYLKQCHERGITPLYDSVHMTATTNKAAEVLGLSTGRPTQTIHSFLNLKVKDDFKTGRSILTKTNLWRVHEGIILFIDECSMIDSDLYRMIQEGTKGCKIVYVGDHSQLAPVMEPISPIYNRNLPFFNLTQPMRNAGQPALLKICDQLRETVRTGTFNNIEVVPGVIDWLDGPSMQDEINSHFKEQNINNNKILAYTNNQVIAYNDYIRELREQPSDFIVGENLINNSAIRLNGVTLSVEDEVVLAEQNPEIIKLTLDTDCTLEIRYCTLTTKFGDSLFNVPVPIDREHYNNLIKYFGRIKNWERYFYMKNTFPDLRQPDASTVHKSQGSSYDTVFIDMSNISTCHNSTQVARMLYVAFSRARSRIILYGQLSPKYGQIIL